MNDDNQHKDIIKRARDLLQQRKRILSLPPDEALNEILDAPQPAALVHSCSEEDLYFLIHDIGPEDSLPLIALASNRQWEYILDMEIWQRDRIDIQSTTRWLDILLKADPNRFIHWFLNEKSEFMEFYLFNFIELRIREHDQDPSDFGDGFFTFDDTFYLRFVETPMGKELDPESGGIIKKQREEFLSLFFKRLADFDHVTFQNVLLESTSIIPAESEEEAYRLRNVRIAEKGFLSFDEAIGIYQPLTPQDLKDRSTKFISEDTDREFFAPIPLYPGGMLDEDNFFSGALKQIDSDMVLQQLQTEFAGLCNQIIAADQKTVRDKAKLKNIVKKACGYLSIGLERLTNADKKIDTNYGAALIRQYPLSNIFRVGYGLALELKWKAERWRGKSWFANQGLPLGFWGEEWFGVLGGLLIKKPMFFDNYKTGVIYREFMSRNEIQETENALNEIIAFDALLSLINIKIEALADRFLTHKGLVLTLWARRCLNLSEELLPIDLNTFENFFDDLWTGKRKPRKIRRDMKESFLNWLSEQSGLKHNEITEQLGRTLENLFEEIENEYGSVTSKDLEPRYVHLFLLKNTPIKTAGPDSSKKTTPDR